MFTLLFVFFKLGTPCECPTEMETPNGLRVVPLPETATPCNYINSSGLRYEAQEVRRCLQAGKEQLRRSVFCLFMHLSMLSYWLWCTRAAVLVCVFYFLAGLLESPDMSHVDSELLARLTEEIREQLRENIHE